MDPQVASLLVVGVAALPVLIGLYLVHMKNGINAKAFAAVCTKMLQAGNPDRLEKLLRVNDTPLIRLFWHVWTNRRPPEAPLGSFDGYRGAERPPTYLERLGPVIKPEVDRVRARYLAAWVWTVPAYATLPLLFFLIGAPRASAPWIIAGVMCLLSLASLVTMVGQRGDVHTTLDQLVPQFERYADEES